MRSTQAEWIAGTARLYRVVAVLFMVWSVSGLAVSSARAQDREAEITADVRFRSEFRDNADFDADATDRQRYIGQRSRLAVDIRATPKLAGRVTVQDTRFWGSEPSTVETSTGNQTLDIIEGYVALKFLFNLPLDLTLGRQHFDYARGRLVGHDDWSNTGRAFDAYRLRFGFFDADAFFFDVFSAKLVDTNTPTGTGRSDQDTNFSGVYFSKGGDRLELLNLYWLRLIDKETPATGEIKRHTFGVLGRYALTPDVTWEVEYAHQSGEVAPAVDISANMLATEVEWAVQGGPFTAHLGYDWASGDGDGAGDRTISTFSQLFPSPHRSLGAMDFVARQNIQDLWGGVRGPLTSSIDGRLDAHWFRLDAPEDGWYSAAGDLTGRAAFGPDAGRRERDLGIEIDAMVDYAFDEGVTLRAGYSRWIAGDLLELDDAPGDDSDFAYFSIRARL